MMDEREERRRREGWSNAIKVLECGDEAVM